MPTPKSLPGPRKRKLILELIELSGRFEVIGEDAMGRLLQILFLADRDGKLDDMIDRLLLAPMAAAEASFHEQSRLCTDRRWRQDGAVSLRSVGGGKTRKVRLRFPPGWRGGERWVTRSIP